MNRIDTGWKFNSGDRESGSQSSLMPTSGFPSVTQIKQQ
jgi:hypothetical protein